LAGVRVLLLEDDENLRFAVEAGLRGAGFAVDAMGTLAELDAAVSVNAYDCAVLDRKVPDGDALTDVRARRAAGFAVPVLFLTALNLLPERIEGLEVGDDYLVKPFAMDELVARVRRLCLQQQFSGPPPVLRCGDLELDTGRHEVRRAGVLLTLTRKEFDVLTELLKHQGQPLSRTELIRRVWDPYTAPKANVVETQIKGLRAKLGAPPMITNLRRTGYRIDPA
jgi:DNA-binding response OmpR family regulator